MTKRYFLVCDSCQNRFPIETSQAGRTIKCVRCGEKIKLGTLRDIRALEPDTVPETAEIKKKSANWSQGRRVTFVVGLIMLVFFGLIGSFSLLKSVTIFTVRPSLKTTEEFKNRVATDSPSTMLTNWEKVDISIVDSWTQHIYLDNRKEVRILRIWGWGGITGAAIGACAIGWSLIKLPKTAARVLQELP